MGGTFRFTVTPAAPLESYTAPVATFKRTEFKWGTLRKPRRTTEPLCKVRADYSEVTPDDANSAQTMGPAEYRVLDSDDWPQGDYVLEIDGRNVPRKKEGTHYWADEGRSLKVTSKQNQKMRD
jgi:hypothetical protein